MEKGTVWKRGLSPFSHLFFAVLCGSLAGVILEEAEKE